MSDRYAILIGSSQFPAEARLTQLACPEQDVDDLHGLLSDAEHGGFTESHLLKNKPHHEVLRRINRVLKKAGKDDLVLIYYSGHGKLDPAGRLYLATHDTEFEALESTSIPVQSIKSYIDISPSTKTALILDCCYSGAVQKAFFRGDVDEQLNLMSGGRGTFIITASTGIQLAKEKEEDRNGVFTKHLIEGIRSGAADRDGDGYITMNEIYQYAHDQVIAESHQEPMKWDLNVRGELYVAKSGKTPREDRRKAIRERLLGLAGEGLIPDEILSAALALASRPATGLNAQERDLDQLLDDLMAERLAVGNFIGRWFRVSAEAPAPEPPPQPKPKPASREEQLKSAAGNTAAKPRKKPAQATAKPAAAPSQAPKTSVVATGLGAFNSFVIFVVLLALHGATAGAFIAMIQELSWYSSSYGRSVDESMLTAYMGLFPIALVVMILLRRFFRRAVRKIQPTWGRFQRIFPTGTSPRAAAWASNLGIISFLLLNALALFGEFEWMF